MIRLKQQVLPAASCLLVAALVAVWSGCVTGGAVVQAVLPELTTGPVVPLEGQGVVVIINRSTESTADKEFPITCVFMRKATTEPNAEWGDSLVGSLDSIGPGGQRDFPRTEGLWDIAISRPSEFGLDQSETQLVRQFFVGSGQIFTITVNDESAFEDLGPNCIQTSPPADQAGGG